MATSVAAFLRDMLAHMWAETQPCDEPDTVIDSDDYDDRVALEPNESQQGRTRGE
ncbi:MAG TPA: hypothetical protein VF522_19180 [Ramlibacter sp.]|uniref:hypothetical protein n=1 Tax=Ramlibacter sp. TaxID=1917967 RepID=UPI002ED59447